MLNFVNVSCDTTNHNNSIPVYDVNDKRTAPVETIEASEQFDKDLLPSSLELKDCKSCRVWKDVEKSALVNNS
ncbi:11647_t:CDS:2 [Funneliformis geosporum]|uniref:9296_t:CDS:1 n=1 Tax=Funneliformis geosporum TaxID=1117311 RepID=A0A9W4SXU7_9GLOM|nr:9296_t:CDS:2 [Funneliformis geosporum]CAI2185663.1 11647_t:CDS:2 [Funneliformis geosporum]